jgi:hypothetical protein
MHQIGNEREKRRTLRRRRIHEREPLDGENEA